MNTEQLKILRTKYKELDDKIVTIYNGIYVHMNYDLDNLDDLFERVDTLKRLATQQKNLAEAISWIETEGK